MANLDNILKETAALTVVALRSFLGTLLIVFLAGVVLAAVSAYLLRDHPLYASIAAVIALAEALASGIVLGGKRALVMALVHGVRSFHLGRSAVRLVFERLLGVSAADPFGERGGMARLAERLPLAQVERSLTSVAERLGAEEQGGRLRRTIHARLIGMVRKYTLARFREENARHGGVDLARVQAELEEKIDDRLVSRLRSGLNLWTAAVVCGLPLVVAVQTYLVIALLK
jgi:hypothetical protein